MSNEKDPTSVSDPVALDAPRADATPLVSRRAALKVLGAVPVAGALLGGTAFAQQGTPTQQLPKQDQNLVATLPGRDGLLHVVVVQDGRYPVAAPDQQLGKGGRHLGTNLFLGPLDGPEGHGR